jgi:hypothetical protein
MTASDCSLLLLPALTLLLLLLLCGTCYVVLAECPHVVHHGGHCGSSGVLDCVGSLRLELQALLAAATDCSSSSSSSSN